MEPGSLVETFSHAAAFGGAAIAIGVTTLATVKSTLFSNEQQQEALITRFGELVRTVKKPGLNYKVPFIDKVAHRVGMDIVQATETLETKTKQGDDIFVKLPITVRYEISDSYLAVFKNRTAIQNMMKSVSASVRNALATKTFQELYTDRDEISTHVIEQIKDDVAQSGIKILKIIIDEPTAPPEVQSAYNNVRASEQLKEAARNKAEAGKITAIAESEAAATAQANAGKGAADFRKAIFDGYKAQIDELTADGKVTREEAIGIVKQAMTLDAMRDVAKHGNVVIIPQSFDSAEFAGTQALRTLAAPQKPVAPAPAVA